MATNLFKKTLNKYQRQEKPKLIFRCQHTQYLVDNNRTSFGSTIKMNLLKKKSSDHDSIANTLFDLHEFSCEKEVKLPKKPIHGALYTIEYTNIYRDWETGYVDDYDLEFVEYIENDKIGNNDG